MRPVRFLAHAALFALLGALPASPARAQAVTPPYNLAQVVASGLVTPRALAFTPDHRILVAERTTGRIRVVKNGVLLAKPFADVPVNFAGDRGALGLATAPDFATSGGVYLLYVRANPAADTSVPSAVLDLRLVRFTASGDTALGGSETLLRSFALDPAATVHVGGGLRVGPEGALYVGLGDGDRAPSPALALDRLQGKVLRLDQAGAAWPTNFFAVDPDPNTLPEIFAYGFHDPAYLAAYRFDDPGPPKIVITDPGNGTSDDEIDEVVSAKNYGWPAVQGKVDTPAESAYVFSRTDYFPPTWTSGAVTTGPTGVAAAFTDDLFLPYAALYWGQSAPGSGQGQVRVAYDVFTLPGYSFDDDFATGLPAITDVSFPTWFPMPVLPMFDELYVLAGSSLWRITPNVTNGVAPGPGVAGVALAHAGPHPARGEAAIACTLPAGAHGRIVLYDPAGRRVRALAPALSGPGTTVVRWDGTSDAGRRAPAGIYVARFVTDDGRTGATLSIVRLP